jgi:hypothetical protein
MKGFRAPVRRFGGKNRGFFFWRLPTAGFQPGRLQITARILRFGRMLAWGPGQRNDVRSHRTADFAAGFRAEKEVRRHA